VSARFGLLVIWYRREGRLVGVLTHEADKDYESRQREIKADAS
jgi:hypothetical protein